MKFPLKVKRTDESYRIEDAEGRCLYLYYEENELRRTTMKRWTKQQAEDLAVFIARHLSEERSMQLRVWEISNPLPGKKPR